METTIVAKFLAWTINSQFSQDAFNNCGAGSGDFRDSMLGHLMRRELDPVQGGVWRCLVCSKQHKSKSLIRDHVEARHGKTLEYTCQLCGRVTKTQDSYKKHMALHKRNDYIEAP